MGTAEATYAQHGVWFTEQAGVAGTAYHMALGVWFDAGLDRQALIEACAAVIARHEVLNTRVEVVDDAAPRLTPADTPPTVVFGELTDGRVAEEIARPYDLRTGPLARFTLLSAADGRHLLLVCAHHLVFDGMSKDVLVRDLAAAYDAAVAGKPVDLTPLPGGYAGHAAAERERVATDLTAAREYWARHWTGPGGAVLPGLSRVPTGAEPGATVEVELGTDLVDGVRRTARSLGATRFELLLAAVHVLLDRYGNRGAPVGVALSTRTPDEADHIGLFVNELPVVVAPATGTFRAYAHGVRAQLRQLYRFRAVPLAHAVSGLRPAPALTPISVGYRKRAPEPTFAGVATRIDWALFGGSARNGLHVQIVDGPSDLAVSLQHSPTAIPTEAVARIGAHLRTLLAALVEDPARSLADLPVLPADELDLLLRTWNQTRRAYPGTTLPALFASQVRATPDAVAVVDGDRTLSYTELDTVSGRLAALLRQHGVGPGSLVAIALDRSWQAVVALLAVLRCRAAYVPVDPGYPQQRQALVLADADPVLVLTTSDTAARLDPGYAVLALDRVDLTPTDTAGGPDGSDLDSGAEPALPTPDDLAYVLYTSGSTGQPKGVAVRHGALANLLLALRDLLDSRPEHRWLNLTSLSFDISGVEIYLPLVTGARVVVASTVGPLDGAGVLRLIRDRGVTHAQATPSGWRVLLEAGLGAAGDGTAGPATPEPLVAVTGGEALPLALARELRSRVGRLLNGYGPTEATIYATMAEIPAAPHEVSIGRPIANVRAYLLDDELRPVPVGVPGELYLAGAGLAAGYLGRDDLTAERFVSDPIGLPEGRLYRTGDRCRWLPDGRIDFLGRTDDQVKIRGHRVELGEITTRLLEHPAVAEAAVLLHVDPADAAGDGEPASSASDGAEPRLVAYLVPQGAAPEPAVLRQHLAQSLPQAMLPAHWVFLDRLPLSPNGKLDRAALPAPETPRGRAEEPAATDLATTDPVTEEIRVIWQQVLQIPEIGLHEDLFDLGGHSLTITRISGRIYQRLGVEVPLEVFFDMPTIAEIADFVRQARGEN